MKKYLILISLGILNAAIPIVLLILTNNDLRYLFVSAFILLFVTGTITTRWDINSLLAAFILIAPLLIGFGILIMSEIISLGYLILPWVVSVLFGVFWGNLKSLRFAKPLGVVLLIIVVFVVNFYFVPQLLRSVLSKELNEPSINFEISALDDSIISSTEFKGKTMVIDFFGTWCGPCIQELPELQKVKDYFKEDNDVVFLIVDNDQPGDSPEKVEQFKIKYGLDFNFFYDYGGKTHKAFGFNGVPNLLIIDKYGNIRFKKSGYNKSESDFKSYMIHLIKEIRDSKK